MDNLNVRTNVTHIIFFALTLCFAAPALAQDKTAPKAATTSQVQDKQAATPEETIILLLSDYHGVPSRETLENVTPKARQVLFSLARDTQLFPLYRHRALSALANWPDPEVKALMFDLLTRDSTPEVLQHHLLGIVPHAFGQASVEVIEPYLTHEDLQLRLSAIGALSRIAHQDAEKVLRRAQATEKNAVARERLEDALLRVR